MGTIADMILEGTLCKVCGGLVDGDPMGEPRCCEKCQSDADEVTDEPDTP